MSRLTPRRLAVLMAALVAVLVVLADASRDRGTVAALPRPGASGPPTVVDGRLPADATVHARAGELVRIHVQAPASDVAESVALGVSTPVGPQVDAPLQFVADQPGRFGIALRYAGDTVGQVVVAPR